jgi:glycolate oxidase iron-sulfur subunit
MKNEFCANGRQPTRKITPDAAIRQAIEKPDNCSRCGFCLNACPVYREYLTESSSPRGKIQLSRQILDGRLDLSGYMKDILSRCLMCGSCSAACPSGVQGAHLFSGMRWLAIRELGLDWRKKTIYRLLAKKWMLAASARFATWADRHFKPLIERGAPSHLPLAGIPPFNDRPFSETANPVSPAAGTPRARVLYFHGCATNYLYAGIGNAVTRVLTRMGVDVHTPVEQGCCGIPIILSGARALSVTCIRSVLEQFSRPDVDAVIVDCATCGSALRREYVPLLRELRLMGHDVDDRLIDQAERLAGKTRDVMEFVADHRDWLPALAASRNRPRFTYHDPCHLVKGQGVGPRLRGVFRHLPNADFVEMQEPDSCCGGGGVFQMDHPDVSAAITARKVENIRRTGADTLATGCPGCRITIGARLGGHPSVRVVHPIELIDAALPDA